MCNLALAGSIPAFVTLSALMEGVCGGLNIGYPSALLIQEPEGERAGLCQIRSRKSGVDNMQVTVDYTVTLNLQGLIHDEFVLCHELRHAWQATHEDEMILDDPEEDADCFAYTMLCRLYEGTPIERKIKRALVTQAYPENRRLLESECVFPGIFHPDLDDFSFDFLESYKDLKGPDWRYLAFQLDLMTHMGR